MVFFKEYFRVIILFAIITTTSGCMKSDEKSYSGPVQGDPTLYFELDMKFSGDNQVTYRLKTIPTDSEVFLKKINQKWHDEAGIKYSAYHKMKEYCATNKNAAMCSNLNEIIKEVESPEVNFFYNMKFFDKDKKEIDNVSGKFVYNLENSDNFKDTWNSVDSSFAMNKSTFRNIESVVFEVDW